MRSLGTLIGVAVIIGTIIFGNSVYQMYADSDKFAKMINNAYAFMDIGVGEFLRWEQLETTEGSFMEGPIYTEELKALEGQRLSIFGFGAPINDGKFNIASTLPNILPQLLLGKAPEPKAWRFQTRFLLTPYPLNCYPQQNPPTNQTIFIQTQNGAFIDIVHEEPLYISGVLNLRGEPGRFFYVLTDVREEKFPGEE